MIIIFHFTPQNELKLLLWSKDLVKNQKIREKMEMEVTVIKYIEKQLVLCEFIDGDVRLGDGTR